MKKRTRLYEIVTYSVIWVLLFAAPVLTELVHSVYDGGRMGMQWHFVWHVWQTYIPFFVAFILHDWLLAPRLIYRHNRRLYITCIIALTAIFAVYQCVDRPDHRHRPDSEAPRRPIAEAPHRPGAESPHGAGAESPHGAGADSPHSSGSVVVGFPDDNPPRPPHHGPPGDDAPFMFSQHDIIATIVFLLMLALNLGLKYYTSQREKEERLAEREHYNLQQQLEYLKYQINPHFLMNTLNNIHALIDIDPAEAQKTIVDLSHLLRFMLYEGSKPLVPLAHELQFLGDYITLMRQRLSDSVDVTFNKPRNTMDDVPTDILVPPLLFITFVENAFKHGVSYKHPSYVHIDVTLDGRQLIFDCRNSRRPEGEAQTPQGGVGLQNVRQRLELLFPGRYNLDITQTETTYSVHLDFPVHKQSIV